MLQLGWCHEFDGKVLENPPKLHANLARVFVFITF